MAIDKNALHSLPPVEGWEGVDYFFHVQSAEAQQRLDAYLVHHVPELSRSFFGKLIRKGLVRVDGKPVKAGYCLRAGEAIAVTLERAESSQVVPQPVDFTIIHEDASVLVVAKPPGLVVHPGAGREGSTLAHGLLYHCATLPGLEEQRPGIVHRLDKDTSGIMLVAKTEHALRQLSEDFRARKIKKTYHAILLRCPAELTGRLTSAIGRHPVQRKKMAIRLHDGRYAATRWCVEKRFDNGLCFVRIDLETGRTHQIRVHMASLNCPVAGDSLYGGQVPSTTGLRVTRQLLHASTISFVHPETGKLHTFTSPIWPDMVSLLDQLQRA